MGAANALCKPAFRSAAAIRRSSSHFRSAGGGALRNVGGVVFPRKIKALAIGKRDQTAEARPHRDCRTLLKYLTTDPEALGVLAWASASITLLGFAFAIWQIMRVKRAADSARDAALAMAQRIRGRELLAKLGDANVHLEAARNHFAGGERAATMLRLELASGALLEAREISRTLAPGYPDLQTLSTVLEQLTEEVSRVTEPIGDDPEFVHLRIEMLRAAHLLKTNIAHSRYDYRTNGD